MLVSVVALADRGVNVVLVVVVMVVPFGEESVGSS